MTTIDIGPLACRGALAHLQATLSLRRDARAKRLTGRIADGPAACPSSSRLARFANHERAADYGISTDGVTLDGLLTQRIEVLPARRALARRGARKSRAARSRSRWPWPSLVSSAACSARSGRYAAVTSMRATGVAANDESSCIMIRMRALLLASMDRARIDDRRVALGRALAALGTKQPLALRCRSPPQRVLDCLDLSRRPLATARSTAAGRERVAPRLTFSLAFEVLSRRRQGACPRTRGRATTTSRSRCARAPPSPLPSARRRGINSTGSSRGVKANGRTILDQLGAWEVEIDALSSRATRYADAVGVALNAAAAPRQAPGTPVLRRSAKELAAASAALRDRGPGRSREAARRRRPRVVAAMRIETRVVGRVFRQPALLPIPRLPSPCALRHGLSSATAYAVAIYRSCSTRSARSATRRGAA